MLNEPLLPVTRPDEGDESLIMIEESERLHYRSFMMWMMPLICICAFTSHSRIVWVLDFTSVGLLGISLMVASSNFVVILICTALLEISTIWTTKIAPFAITHMLVLSSTSLAPAWCRMYPRRSILLSSVAILSACACAFGGDVVISFLQALTLLPVALGAYMSAVNMRTTALGLPLSADPGTSDAAVDTATSAESRILERRISYDVALDIHQVSNEAVSLFQEMKENRMMRHVKSTSNSILT